MGCFCQVVDICVLPPFQGHGLGKRIMGRIMKYIDEVLPATCYDSVVADGDAYNCMSGMVLSPFGLLTAVCFFE